MKFFVVFALVVVASEARSLQKRAAQNPPVWIALRALRGNKDIVTEEQQSLLANAVPGQDYPINAVIPDKTVDCSSYHQPGFYADVSEPSKCQVFHRCDVNGIRTSYLCPNGTLFNQITLICDWFFNVNCGQSANFYGYSNSRLYSNAPLLDNSDEIAEQAGAASKSAAKPIASKPADKTATVGAKPAHPSRERKSDNENVNEGNALVESATQPVSETTAASVEVTTAAAAETTATPMEVTSAAAAVETTIAANSAAPAEVTTPAAPAETSAAAAETTPADSSAAPAEVTTPAAPAETSAAAAETTPAGSSAAPAEVTTPAAPAETSAAAAETTPADSSAAPVEVTTPAAPAETSAAATETTPAGSSAAPAEVTTPAAPAETSTAAVETTAAAAQTTAASAPTIPALAV